MKKGLVLEGGAIRGMFTAGVLDVFMEEGIEFDGAVGTSAGALFGCNFKSRQPKRAVTYSVECNRDPRYGSFRNLLKEGNYYSKDFAFGSVHYELYPFDTETFAANPMEFYMCATEMETGNPVYFKSVTGTMDEIEWYRATSAMPLFSKPIEIDGEKYMDGGIADSVPLEFFEGIGYEKNVVILTREPSYRKKPSKTLPLVKQIYKDYPNFVEAVTDRHTRYNECLNFIREREHAGAAYVIRPYASLKISHLEKDPKEILRVYRYGRKIAKSELSRIKEFLELT